MSSNGPGGTPPNKGEGNRSNKIDPWEARERERAKYRRTPRSERSSLSEEIWTETDISLRENYLVAGMLLSIFLLVASGIPYISGNVSNLLLQTGTFLSLLLLGTCRAFLDNMYTALRRGPNLPMVLLCLWTGYTFMVSPFRASAASELLRVVSGISIYFLAAYTIKSPRQVSFAVTGLLGMGVLISLYDLLHAGIRGNRSSISDDFSILGTHQHIGSLLTLLFPMGLIFALNSRIEEKRRLTATAATLILGVTLLASRSRSGWSATFIAMLVLAALYLRFIRSTEAKTEPQDKRPTWLRMVNSPVVQVVVALAVFLGLSNLAPLVSQRASLLKVVDDSSFTGRLSIWNGAKLMIAEKPLTGWGLGAFPVLQGEFSHTGDEPSVVLTNGTSHLNNAHDYYLQWASETGAIGIFLHITVLSAFLITLLNGLPQSKTPFQTSLIIGSVAIVVASLVDGLASPMYHFSGIWAILYAWLGLGIAALRPISTSAKPSTAPALGPTSPTVWTGSILCGLLVTGSILLWVRNSIEQGKKVPRGNLQVVAYPIGPVAPGTSVLWTAVFTDEKGITRPTMPGTNWHLDAPPIVMNQAETELRGYSPRKSEDSSPQKPSVPPEDPVQISGLRVSIPGTTPLGTNIAIKATYRDAYDRIYEAWSYKKTGIP